MATKSSSESNTDTPDHGAEMPATEAPAQTAGTPHVYEAIRAVQAGLGLDGIGKDRSNLQQGYKFRGIDDIYNALAKHLAQNGLVIIPALVSRSQTERMTANNKPIFYTDVVVDYHLISSVDGSSHVARMAGEAMDSADKSTNKAMSAAYKYLALQLFCIPTEGDNDADATTYELAPRHQHGAPQPDRSPQRAAPQKPPKPQTRSPETADAAKKGDALGVDEYIKLIGHAQNLGGLKNTFRIAWKALADSAEDQAKLQKAYNERKEYIENADSGEPSTDD